MGVNVCARCSLGDGGGRGPAGGPKTWIDDETWVKGEA